MGGPDSISSKALKQSLALSLWRKAAADLLFVLKKETVMLEDGQVAGGGL